MKRPTGGRRRGRKTAAAPTAVVLNIADGTSAAMAFVGRRLIDGLSHRPIAGSAIPMEAGVICKRDGRSVESALQLCRT